jgi:hypothetical protein
MLAMMALTGVSTLLDLGLDSALLPERVFRMAFSRASAKHSDGSFREIECPFLLDE